MRKKYLLPIGLVFIAFSGNAQDIYKMEMMAGSDLNGTARYVGMGGAMNALGADLSTIGNNPAAIGLYRKSDVAMTGSVLIQPNAKEMWDINKARASFDQIGFVYAAKMDGDLKFINFGFNYHKSRNMKNFIGVNGVRTGGLSQSLQMLDLSYVNGSFLDLDKDEDRGMTTPLTCLGFDTYMLDYLRDAQGNAIYNENGKPAGYTPCEADSYDYARVQWGGIQSYDFNISLNWSEQVYGGLTFGVKNVDIHSGTYYSEMLNFGKDGLHPYYMTNEEALTGAGYDVKLGLIVRPFETSPFRIGFAVHTPTFYDLKNDSYLYMESPFYDEKDNTDYTARDVNVVDNDYEIRTPWKFNVSMATTIENMLALDMEYEFSNYSSMKVSYPDYDYYDSPFSNGSKDRALNEEADRFLKPVSSFKFGAEARLSSNLYARAGYNYVSAPFEKDAFLNLFTSSPSYFYNTNTDYVNLGETQRATCGLGYKSKHLYADIAYQYQKQDGELYTFHVPEDHSDKNRLEGKSIDFVRHNLMLTIGYKF